MARFRKGWGKGWGRFPRYIPVAERRAQAEEARLRLEKALEKNPGRNGGALHHVMLRYPLKSWWARAWCQNLERYADELNRIDRGRDYARNGSVLDLRLEAGIITALVHGSRPAPYEVEIKIETLRGEQCRKLADLCGGKLESVEALLAGSFPRDLERLLVAEKQGLFPHPRQIKFSCSCPDWADMCKHVAAALYGAGARLDEDPSLFFTLRGMKMEELIGRVVEKGAEELLGKRPGAGWKKGKKGEKGKGESRVLELNDAALGKLFGLDFGSQGTRRRKRRPT